MACYDMSKLAATAKKAFSALEPHVQGQLTELDTLRATLDDMILAADEDARVFRSLGDEIERLKKEKDDLFLKHSFQMLTTLTSNLDHIARTARMKKSRDETTERMKAALKEKEKVEKQKEKAEAKAKTLADAQFTIDRLRERVQELEEQSDAYASTIEDINKYKAHMEEEMREMCEKLAENSKDLQTLRCDKAKLFAGQLSYAIAARIAQCADQGEEGRLGAVGTLEAYWEAPNTRVILEENRFDDGVAKVLAQAKQIRTRVAHPSTLPPYGEVKMYLKALGKDGGQDEAAILNAMVCLKRLNKLCGREETDLSSN